MIAWACLEEALLSQAAAVKGRVQFPSGDAWVQAWGEDPRFCLDKVGKSR